MELPKNRATLIASAAVAGTIATAAVAMLAWPALTRPEPPSEAAANADGVRIKLVQPPKAAVARTGLLDVGLSDAALTMAKGRQALSDTFTSTPPPPATRPAPRRAPIETTPLLIEDDRAPPPEDFADIREDRWERERLARQQDEAMRRGQWERERRIDEAREERDAWERERLEDQRWRDSRVEDDRYDPPPRERW